MKYRPHVDGLRALAILFVLFFHAGLTLFPSGFIGVDIFFVISGFLITGLIHSSLQTNNFSFIEFYNRRLWRLQPVFICLILVTTILTLIYYLPDDLSLFTKSARKTSLFISNLYFQQVTDGYFAANTNHLPLLHTWSLSIEWQCYLFLPIALYLLHRMVGQKHLAKVVYLLTVLFVILALHYSSVAPLKSYYQFLSRIFEFLIGSCVALTPRRFAFNRHLVNLISLAALVALFYIARLQGINIGFPNWYAFTLCLATAILIASGEGESKPLCIKFLSLKPFVFIGLLSYSLYIWHWPVFVLIRYLDIKETATVIFFAFCLIALVAYFSWRFIEKPSRKLSKTPFSYSLAFLFILPLIIFYLSDYGIKKFDGYPQRFHENLRIQTLLKKYYSPQRELCLSNGMAKEVSVNASCLLGAQNITSRKGFMIGDSFANHSWRFMDLLAKNADLSILAYSTAGCLSLPGILPLNGALNKNNLYQNCRDQTKLFYKMIKENHYDFVILSHFWHGHFDISHMDDQYMIGLFKESHTKAVNEALQLIIASGARPVLIKSIATPTSNARNCFYKHIIHREEYKPELCDFSLNPKQGEWFDELFAKMQKKYAQLIIIDPREVQCPSGLCKAAINGVPVFRDLTHITDYASYYLAKSYLKQSENPLRG
ncbi:MAG: acyltransferase [Tatlockia sp.]|nr:acyltransferase [Tatlockia sp.]